MTRLARLLPALLVLAALPAPAAVEIVFEDGTEISGSSLEREGDLYLLKLETGETIAFPFELVSLVRLTDEVAGLSEAEESVGLPDLGEELAGEGYAPVRPTAPSEQLAAFGRGPAAFRTPPVASSWTPEDSLGYRSDVTQFNPSRWFRPAHDPTWGPTSGYEKTSGPPDFNTSRWYRPPVRSVWRPRDGWGSTVWFPPLFATRD